MPCHSRNNLAVVLRSFRLSHVSTSHNSRIPLSSHRSATWRRPATLTPRKWQRRARRSRRRVPGRTSSGGPESGPPTKDGRFTKEALRTRLTITSSRCSQLGRPTAVAARTYASRCAQTLFALHEEWRMLRTSHILGAGVDPLLKLLDHGTNALAVFNTFGTPGVDRGPAASSSAIRGVLSMTAKIHRHARFRDMLMALL